MVGPVPKCKGNTPLFQPGTKVFGTINRVKNGVITVTFKRSIRGKSFLAGKGDSGNLVYQVITDQVLNKYVRCRYRATVGFDRNLVARGLDTIHIVLDQIN